MDNKYKIIKIFEKKSTRFIALIEYKKKKAILKKITTTSTPLLNKFINEVNILIKIDKFYIPKVYENGEDYMIMEYFESYDNKPEKFAKYANDIIINKIVSQLMDINTTVLENIEPVKNKFLLRVYKIVFKLWLNKYFKFFHLKVLFLLTFLYLKNMHLFNILVATKGDFTEVNILVNNDEDVRFIDFDTYNPNGAWLQDASYLLLHQDIEVKKLVWQKEFYKKYLIKIKQQGIELNNDYIRFWLLYTAINQFSIRYLQERYNLIPIVNNALYAKEEHIKYFLDSRKFKFFLSDIGV